MSLSNIKRKLQLGTAVKMIRHDGIPANVSFSLVGTVRRVNLVQANAIRFEPHNTVSKGSWLYWPKAGSVRETAKGFEVDLNDYDPRLKPFDKVIAYEYVEQEGKNA